MKHDHKAKSNALVLGQRQGNRPNWRLKLAHQAILLVVLPMSFEILFFGLLYHALREAEDEANRAEYARDVADHITAMSQAATKTGVLAYFYSRRPIPALEDNFHGSINNLLEAQHEMEERVKADPEALATARKLEAESRSLLALVEKGAHACRAGDNVTADETASRVTTVGRQLLEHINSLADKYKKIGQAGPGIQQANRQKLKSMLLLGVCSNVVLALCLVGAFILTTGKKLGVIMDNVKRLALHSQLHDRLDGDDELAHLDKAFHETEQLLSETTRLREQLIGIASHELRTPLTSVDACLKMMLDGVYGELPVLARTRVEGAEKSLVRLIELINDLLDVEKIQSETMILHLSDIKIDSIIALAIESVSTFAQTQGIDLRTHECSLTAYADEKQLVQVLVNLLSNAVKFSPAGSAVEILGSAVGGFTEVRVTDSADTIPATKRQEIFERFASMSTDSTSLTPLKGTGLGLAISKSIIERHGGTIGVNPREPQGNIFWFRVPVHPAKTADTAGGSNI